MAGARLRNELNRWIEAWLMAAEREAFAERFRWINRWFWKLPIRATWCPESRLYRISDAKSRASPHGHKDRIFVARRERLLRYRRGVAARIDRLARKYFIDRVPLEAGDAVVDCGANVGEIGLYCQARAAVRYVPIEPSEREALACDQNAFGSRSRTQRAALWNVSGERTFYESNVTADSSLIEPASHAGETKVRVRTLDEVAYEAGLQSIRLLKIEGEGAEPEILEGGTTTLERTDYCTVDCGPERGATAEHVIPQVCNLMFAQGFELVDVNLERQIHLFRNRRLS